MGLNYEIAKFLLFAEKKRQVDFGRTLTLGRQALFLPQRHLSRLLRRFGHDPALASSIIANGGDALFKAVGARSLEALDISAYEGAGIIQDLNKPIPDVLCERYTCVFDGGVLHYIFNIPQAIENCMRMIAPGGWFLSATMANNACGHGLYQFSPALFYAVFSAQNGFQDTEVFLAEEYGWGRWYKIDNPRHARSDFHFANRRLTHMFVLSRRGGGPARVKNSPLMSQDNCIPRSDNVAQPEQRDLGLVTRTSRALRARLPNWAYLELQDAFVRLKTATPALRRKRLQRFDPFKEG